MLGVNRLFVAEHEQGGFDGFLLAPVDRSTLLVAKAIGAVLYLTAVELMAVPAVRRPPPRALARHRPCRS